MSKYTIRTNGFLALYNGLSAAALMSATYSTSRFAFYGFAKEYLLSVKSTKSANKNVDDLTLMEKIFISSLSGVVGSLFGKFVWKTIQKKGRFIRLGMITLTLGLQKVSD